MSDQLVIEIEQDGIIRVMGAGLWRPDAIRTHFEALHRVIKQIRADNGLVFVLVDLREAMVQPAETAEIVRQETARIYREADRVAIVCATMLLAMQMKRSAQVRHLATFQQVEPARDWLRMQLAA